eukprot:TRINITY_DN12964_c0_g1_i3.p1 TRINITY_DN12964_c0_g1~~TRINITY_DN12964_c0_g1_i3.p1  ORF type:complete len:148 (+),score=24.52 TRINITY_DN12964_c0_g1_i3:40-483(+)
MSNSTNRRRGRDERDGASSSSGFGSGLLTGLGLAAGGLLLGYGLSLLTEEESHTSEERGHRQQGRHSHHRAPVNDLPPPRRRESNTTEEVPQEKRCVVCLTGEKEVIVLDCGHVCMCLNCGHEIMRTRNPKCPICRAPVDQLKKFYM